MFFYSPINLSLLSPWWSCEGWWINNGPPHPLSSCKILCFSLEGSAVLWLMSQKSMPSSKAPGPELPWGMPVISRSWPLPTASSDTRSSTVSSYPNAQSAPLEPYPMLNSTVKEKSAILSSLGRREGENHSLEPSSDAFPSSFCSPSQPLRGHFLKPITRMQRK